MSFVDDWAYAAAPEDDEEPEAVSAWCHTCGCCAGPECERRAHKLHFNEEES